MTHGSSCRWPTASRRCRGPERSVASSARARASHRSLPDSLASALAGETVDPARTVVADLHNEVGLVAPATRSSRHRSARARWRRALRWRARSRRAEQTSGTSRSPTTWTPRSQAPGGPSDRSSSTVVVGCRRRAFERYSLDGVERRPRLRSRKWPLPAAEGGGFEPPGLVAQRFSRPSHSSALPSLLSARHGSGRGYTADDAASMRRPAGVGARRPFSRKFREPIFSRERPSRSAARRPAPVLKKGACSRENFAN